MGSATGTAIVTLKESVPSIKSERAREITTHNKCIHTLIIGVLYDRFSLKKFRIQMEKNWISSSIVDLDSDVNHGKVKG